MNNNDLFVIILIVCSFSINLDDIVPTKVEAQDTFFLAASEGMVAMQVADTSTPEQVVPQDLCKCAGKGYIQFPDGNKTKCQCGDNCNCKKTNDNSTGSKPDFSKEFAEEASKVSRKPDKQIVWLTAKWCGPCQSFEGNPSDNTLSPAEELRKGGWGVDDNEFSHMRKVDVDEHPDMYKNLGKSRPLPLFLLLNKNEEVKSIVGYTSAKNITDMYYGN